MRNVQRYIIFTTFRLLGAIPLRLRQSLGRGAGRLVAIFSGRERHLSLLQLQLALGNSDKSIPTEMYSQIGQTFLESLNLSPILSDSGSITVIAGEEIIKRTAQNQSPLVALTGHVGNWDLLAAYIVARGINLCTVARRARNSLLHELLEDLRLRYGVKSLWRSRQAGQAIISELKQGKVVAALIDQDTRVRSISVPFFNYPASTPVGLVTIAKKLDVPIVSAFLVRVDKVRFEVYIKEIDSSKTEEDILKEYHSHLEDILRRFPAQWVWFHKRWRTLADNTRLSSEQYLQYLTKELKANNGTS